MTLAEYLAAYRISRRQFAVKLGVSLPTLSRWLAPGGMPPPSQMVAIYRATSGAVTPNDIVLDGVRKLTPFPLPERAPKGSRMTRTPSAKVEP